MTLAAGRLRHRVRLEVNVMVQDSNGDFIQDQNTGEVLREWTLLGEVYAAIEPLSAKEFIQSQALQSSITTRIVIREPRTFTVTAGCRAVHGVRVYDIHGVLPDRDSGLEYLTLPCSLGVNPNGA